MRVFAAACHLGDTTRHTALVTDDRHIAASATIEGADADAIAALDMLELRLIEAIHAVRNERARLEQEAA